MRIRRVVAGFAVAGGALAGFSASGALAAPTSITPVVHRVTDVSAHSFVVHLSGSTPARFRVYVARSARQLTGRQAPRAPHTTLVRSRTIAVRDLPSVAGRWYFRVEAVSGSRHRWSRLPRSVVLPPARPASLVVKREGSTATLTWRGVAGTGYEVETATDPAMRSHRKDYRVGTATHLRTTGLAQNLPYYVRVRSVNLTRTSAWSANVRTAAAAPLKRGGSSGSPGRPSPTTAPPTSPPPTGTSLPPSSPAPSPSSPAPSAPTAGPLLPPKSGVVMGAFVNLPGQTQTTSMPYRERQWGITFGIASHYYDWADPFPGRLEAADEQAGRTPMVTWWGTDLTAINNGSQDALITAAAARVKAFGHPLFLRWAAEMNGDWYTWSGALTPGGPASFVRAWQRIHDIFAAAGVENASWVWAPNADSHPGGTSPTAANNWRNYYPGDAYVDWVGIDGYNRGSTPNQSWESFASIFDPVYADYAGRKPIMIAETSSVDAGGDKGAWIDGARSWIKTHPDVHALVWFDTTTSCDWRADSSPSAWTAMTGLVHDPYFQAHLG
jgi:hypothetical protein